MLNLNTISTNSVTIAGKLIDVQLREGTTKTTGKPYVGGNVTVRVHQKYLGNDEVSEIRVPFFAQKFTNAGTVNPAYTSLSALGSMKTIQSNGEAEADFVRINRASLRENSYVNRTGQIVDRWEVSSNFINKGQGDDVASFKVNFVVLNKRPEVDKEGEETGRLLIKGAVVQYGERLDVFDFVIDDPNAAAQVDAAWDDNATISAWGRIRVTVKEDKKPTIASSWGEDAPVDVSTHTVAELVLTGGNPIEDEDYTYDIAEIKKGFNQRKAMREQLVVNSNSNVAPAAATKPAAKKSYAWE